MAARNQENVANDINKEVLINWPVNVDIVSAKCMERKLSNCKADEWKILLVKILAVGEWTDMCQQAKNIKRFGVANPTKEERHRLCKKDSTTDEESSTSSCLDDAGKSIKNYQQQKTAVPKKKCGNHKSSKQNIALNINANILDKIQKVTNQELSRSGYTFSDDEISDKENNNSSNTKQLMHKITVLRQENKKLQLENTRLRTLQCIDDDLYNIKNMSTDILENVTKIQQRMDMLTLDCEYEKKEKFVPKVSTNALTAKKLLEQRNDTTQSASASTSMDSGERMIDTQEIKRIEKIKGVCATEHYRECDNTKNNTTQSASTSIHSGERMIDTQEIKRICATEHYRECDNTKNNTTQSASTSIDFGGRMINMERIKRIEKTRGACAYLSALMSVIFTQQEMAICTMTGTISNFQKKKLDGNDNKKTELNPVIRDAILDYVMQEFNIPVKTV